LLEGLLAGIFALQAALLGKERHGAHQVLDVDDADNGLKKKGHYYCTIVK
jgi:hypothetical protein